MNYSLYFKPSDSTEIAGYLRLEVNGVASSGVLPLPSSSDLLDPNLAVEKVSETLDSKDSFFSPCLSMLSVPELTGSDIANPYELLVSFTTESSKDVKQEILKIVEQFPKLIPELYL